LGVPVRQAEKIATVVKAANVKVESYWPALFAKLLEKRSVEDLILSVGSGIPPTSLSFYYVYVCAHDSDISV
jgi:ribosomal protein L12E/L44/L45/RPP1/RPP2